MAFSFTNYYNPTPKKMRQFGDALLGVSTTITAYAVAAEWSRWISIIAVVFGAIGKFLTNFYADDSTVTSTIDQPTIIIPPEAPSVTTITTTNVTTQN